MRLGEHVSKRVARELGPPRGRPQVVLDAIEMPPQARDGLSPLSPLAGTARSSRGYWARRITLMLQDAQQAAREARERGERPALGAGAARQVLDWIDWCSEPPHMGFHRDVCLRARRGQGGRYWMMRFCALNEERTFAALQRGDEYNSRVDEILSARERRDHEARWRSAPPSDL